jgi:hypothetical protein
MRNAIVLAVVAGLAALFGTCTVTAQELPQLKEKCPVAAAWLSTSHDGLSSQQRKKLRSIKPSDPALAEQLAQRYARDQAAEEAAVKAHAYSQSKVAAAKSPAVMHLFALQRKDLDWLKPIVAAQGFPTIQQVGPNGVEHAWMLVQHAGADPKFQAQVLAELKPRLSSEPYLRNDYALLMDRVRLAEHKPQLYGTQFTVKDGRLAMQATEGVTHLNKRRATMGLMPVSDYRCFLKVLYHMPSHPASSQSVAPHKRS